MQGNVKDNVAAPEEKYWIDKAVSLHYGSDKDSREEAERVTRPSVVVLQNKVCVGLKLKENSLGGDFSVCFLKADGSVVEVYTDGE